MNAPAWLTARPIAHRGLHGPATGTVENSLGAARAALARGFAIECDVQLSQDGEAMVFHDSTLDRLTEAHGAVASLPAQTLAATMLKGAGETIPTLARLLQEIAGAAPLICEIKSAFDGDFRLADRVAETVATYSGPVAIKSFDPEVIAHLRARAVDRPLGVVAEASYDHPYFDALSHAQKQSCAAFLHVGRTRPDFLSWCIDDFPHPTPNLMRALGAIPVMTWTVRTAREKRLAAEFADQIVFEGEPD